MSAQQCFSATLQSLATAPTQAAEASTMPAEASYRSRPAPLPATAPAAEAEAFTTPLRSQAPFSTTFQAKGKWPMSFCNSRRPFPISSPAVQILSINSRSCPSISSEPSSRRSSRRSIQPQCMTRQAHPYHCSTATPCLPSFLSATARFRETWSMARSIPRISALVVES